MTRVKKHKRIKITSRGLVFTSRGRCRTPILRPYVENCDTILQMLTRDNATIVEVLDNGQEIKLTVQNFASDNSSAPVQEVKPEPKKEEVKPVVIPAVDEMPIADTTPEVPVVEEEPTVEDVVVEPVVETTEEEPTTEDEEDEEVVEESAAAEGNKHLSRKERRKLEQKQRAEANRQANAPVVGDATVPTDSIEE